MRNSLRTHYMYAALARQLSGRAALSLLSAYGEEAQSPEEIRKQLRAKGAAIARVELAAMPKLGPRSIALILDWVFAPAPREAETLRETIARDPRSFGAYRLRERPRLGR
jgi:hypothetical protein